jgi:hypothetical protein
MTFYSCSKCGNAIQRGKACWVCAAIRNAYRRGYAACLRKLRLKCLMLFAVVLLAGCGGDSLPAEVGACCLRDQQPLSAAGNVDQICRTIYSPPLKATTGQESCEPDEWFRDAEWAGVILSGLLDLGYCLHFDGPSVRERIDFICMWQTDDVCKKWKAEGKTWCTGAGGVWADGKWRPYGL